MSVRGHTITAAERARIDQLDRLVALGARGVGELITALADPSWTVRRAAVASLASLGDDSVVQLCRFLAEHRTNENAIAAAVDALSASIGQSVVGHVLALAGHARAPVVADAAQILGRRRAFEATSVLVGLIDHPDDNAAVAAIEALGAIGGSPAVQALISVIERRNFFRTYPAMQVLARTGDPRAVAPLAKLLADEQYRVEAVRALGRTGAPQAIAPIAELLSGASDAIVRLIAVALAELIERADWAGGSQRIGETLRTALSSSLARLASALHLADADERIAIVTVLGRAGDATVLPDITGQLDDPASGEAATSALRHLGETSDDALIAALATADSTRRAVILSLVRSRQAAPSLRDLLRDEDGEVRARACEALARIGDTTSVPQLFAALGDPSPRVAHAAVSAIQALGTSDTEALALEAARSSTPTVRRNALRILGSFGFRSGFPLLRAAIDDPDLRIAELAIVAMGAVDDPRVDGVLEQVATSRDHKVRSAVMRSICHRGGERGVALLARGLADGSAWVRYYAVQAIGRLGADAAALAPRVSELLRDPAPQVRVAAIETLSQLGSGDAWDAVCGAARSTDPDERRAGLVGLGLHAHPGSAEILVEAARSPDLATRLVAVAGLARSDSPEALNELGRALADPAVEVRTAALSLLADRNDAASAHILVERALDAAEDDPVHQALSRPSAAHIVAILSRLTSADARTAPVLAAALARMHADAGNVALFEVLAMTNPAARAAAASALVVVGAPGARTAVAALSTGDPDLEVRRVCAAALTVT